MMLLQMKLYIITASIGSISQGIEQGGMYRIWNFFCNGDMARLRKELGDFGSRHSPRRSRRSSLGSRGNVDF